MSDAFKGVPGGDPSRKPPVVVIRYTCVICGNAATVETRKPEAFTIPSTCSNLCEATLTRQKAMDLIRELLGEAPDHDSIPQDIADELMQAHGYLVAAKAKPGLVKAVIIVCAHCGKEAIRFSFNYSRQAVSSYCSWGCRDARQAKLPFGVICRSPRKSHYESQEQAQFSAERFNVQLAERGDLEGVRPYECDGHWHIGHGSKSEWLEAAMKAIELVSAEILTMVRPTPARTPKQRNRKRKRAMPAK